MTLWATDLEGKKRLFPAPVRLELRCDEETPADCLTVVLPSLQGFPICRELCLLSGQGETLFCGIVDRQEQGKDVSGDTILLEGRSLAALLTDNEALPRRYQNPRLPQLFAVHAAPYGLKGYTGDSQTFAGEYQVDKGMTEWQAMEGFCRRYLKVHPRITPDGILHAGDARPQGELVLGGSNLPLLAMKEIRRPEKRLSEIRFRVRREGGYDEIFTDEEARRMGIRRRRLINLADGQSSADSAKALFQEGRHAAWYVQADCPGGIFSPLGTAVRLQGRAEKLYLSGMRYTLEPGRESTTLFLRKEEQV